MAQKVYTAGESRVWIQPRGCNTPMLYAGCYGMGDATMPEGAITNILCPSPSEPNVWDTVGKVKAIPANKTASLEAPFDLVNYLMHINCEFNVQLRIGACARPDDPAGWETIIAFEGAEITSRGLRNLNGRAATTNEILSTADIEFSKVYDVHQHSFTAVTVSATSGALVEDISFCDSPVCAGSCGVGSVGCQTGYAVINAAPGEIWKTEDGGGSWDQLGPPFAGAYGNIIAVDCSNDVVIVINGSTPSEIGRSSDGGATWTAIDVGSNKTLYDLFMLDSANVWLAGEGGYIFYSNDGGLTWEVQNAGVATAEDLYDIYFFDTEVGIAVGANGAIVATTDGGTTWTAQTSGTAEDLNAVFATTGLIFWVGGTNGTLLYTMNGGTDWNVKVWPGSATDSINAIKFCGCMFGFFGATTAAPVGRIFSTYDGGYTFREEVLSANLGINAIECCDPNNIFVATNGGGKIFVAS